MLKLKEILKPAIDKRENAPPTTLPHRRSPARAENRPGKPAPAAQETAPGTTAKTGQAPTRQVEVPATRTEARSPEFGPEIAAKAEREARNAHAGQTDKAGRPYEEHLARVAGVFGDPGDVAVAWLHDTVEDTALAVDELVKRGIPQVLADDVATLTRQGVERYGGYIERVGSKGSDRAVAVKAADVRDHLEVNPAAIASDHRRRYRHALKRLRHHARRRDLPSALRVLERAATTGAHTDPDA
ncbi:MAG: hypothetical protein OXG35_32150 [Acidobacteria bacterium]|nr:hypothetical protein [Acidobacteriota bacterium]